ncbi:MAG: hypothetical protein ACREV7_06545 [Steroidobacteraceae bacterium]
MRVHLPAEHALELEAPHIALEPLGIPVDVARRGLITLRFGELEELRRIGNALGGAIELRDVGGESRALLAELLRALRLGPDGRVLELPPYLLEALFLVVVLKETSVARRCARPGL